MTTHTEIRAYINQVAKALANAGIPVSHVTIDSPEQAAYWGREWACIDINVARPAQCLVWSDRQGWLVGTHADHYPLRPGEPCPAPKDVAKGAASHIHTLAHGGHLPPLGRS